MQGCKEGALSGLLAVLLLDPGGNVEAPRIGHEESAGDVEAVDGAAAEDVQQVGLGDTEEAKGERSLNGTKTDIDAQQG